MKYILEIIVLFTVFLVVIGCFFGKNEFPTGLWSGITILQTLHIIILKKMYIN